MKWIKTLFKAPALRAHNEAFSQDSNSKNAKHLLPLQTLSTDERIYAIGDIHGRYDLLEALLKSIDSYEASFPRARSIEVILGDMIDRGAQSKEVIDALILRGQNRKIKVLRGNHENMMLDLFHDTTSLLDWISVGGLNTLLSYGISPQMPTSFEDYEAFREQCFAQMLEKIPENHIKFLKSLDLAWQYAGFIFVHAGLRPKLSLAEQRDDDLTQIRNPFLNFEEPFEGYVVHGHTPVKAIDVRKNRINLDTGAFATGNLSCVVFENQRLFRLLPFKEGAAIEELIEPLTIPQ